MFTVRRLTAAQIGARIGVATEFPPHGGRLLSAEGGSEPRVPFLFSRDTSAKIIGQGVPAFAAARRAFESWTMFDLGWVRVANLEARIVTNQLVAVEAHTLGLWTLNVSRIMEVVDGPGRFGFVYATTDCHVEEGEERFFLELDLETGDVIYKLEAVSRPRHVLARVGLPITRMFQHRFARDSRRRMREATNGLLIP